MKMDLLEFYQALLKTAGMTVVDEDYVSLQAGKDKIPAMINDKRLVLPTKRQLRSLDFENQVVFHPMSENIMHGESEVLAYYRECLNSRLNLVFNMLMLELTQIAASPSQHATLDPDQAEYLSRVKEADEETFTRVAKLANAIDGTDPRRSIVWIFLKRSGAIVDGRRYSRGSVVNFPLYEEIVRVEKGTDKNRAVYGVSMRVKDLHVLKALLEYMMPNINRPETLVYGTDATTAPFLESLLQAVKRVAGPLNDLVALFGDQLTNAEKLQFENSWVEVADNLGVLREQANAIPMQAGNEGGVTDTPADTATASRPAAGPAFAATPQQANPTAAPGFRQQVGVHPQAQQNATQAPQIVKTADGIDFNSVLQANPVLNYVLNAQVGMMPGMGGQMQMQGQRQPRWSQPGHPMYNSGMPGPAMQPQGQMFPGGGYPGQGGFPQPGMQGGQGNFGFPNRGFGSGI